MGVQILMQTQRVLEITEEGIEAIVPDSDGRWFSVRCDKKEVIATRL